MFTRRARCVLARLPTWNGKDRWRGTGLAVLARPGGICQRDGCATGRRTMPALLKPAALKPDDRGSGKASARVKTNRARRGPAAKKPAPQQKRVSRRGLTAGVWGPASIPLKALERSRGYAIPAAGASQLARARPPEIWRGLTHCASAGPTDERQPWDGEARRFPQIAPGRSRRPALSVARLRAIRPFGTNGAGHRQPAWAWNGFSCGWRSSA